MALGPGTLPPWRLMDLRQLRGGSVNMTIFGPPTVYEYLVSLHPSVYFSRTYRNFPAVYGKCILLGLCPDDGVKGRCKVFCHAYYSLVMVALHRSCVATNLRYEQATAENIPICQPGSTAVSRLLI